MNAEAKQSHESQFPIKFEQNLMNMQFYFLFKYIHIS